MSRVVLALVIVFYQQAALDLLKQAKDLVEQAMSLLVPPSPIVAVTCDTIQGVINAGVTPDKTLTLPVGVNCGPITLKGPGATITTDSPRPPDGVRLAPLDALTFARFFATGTVPAISCVAGAAGWTLRGIEVVGHPASNNNTLALLPGCNDTVIDQIYVHGDPTDGAKNGIALNGGAATISNSTIKDFKRAGQDTQAIVGTQGPGPYTITNNLIEGAGENILFGGDDPKTLNLIPSDITITGNLIRKPLEWRAQNWSVKALLELKNARRVTITDNVLENNWLANQVGYSVLFTPRNQGGNCPWCTVEDVVFARNTIRHIAGGFNLLGTDNLAPSGRTTNIKILDTTIEDLDGVAYGGNGYTFLINGVNGLEIRGLKVSGKNIKTAMAFEPRVTDGLIVADSQFIEGKYGIFSSKGLGILALNAWAPGYQWSNVTLNRDGWPSGTSVKYPDGTTLVKP